jgi:excisionase family DNA binding protein
VRTATRWTFLILAEVADILRIGKRTAYELAHTGRLGGATKVGGSW